MICPHCDEEIKDGATKCKHCKEWLPASSTEAEKIIPPKEEEKVCETVSNPYSATRPSIRSILSNEYWKNNDGETPLTLRDYGRGAANIGLISLATLTTGSPVFLLPFVISASSAFGSKIGINSKKKAERTFSIDYPHTALLLSLALHDTNRKIEAVEDTEGGCIIQAALESDWKSFGGTLFFEIIEKNKNQTFVIGKSLIKGQLIDWGKGKSTLNELFDKVSSLEK